MAARMAKTTVRRLKVAELMAALEAGFWPQLFPHMGCKI